ncbi:MAG: omega-amidase [Bacteroidia bacterium]|jgi:omega-amidase
MRHLSISMVQTHVVWEQKDINLRHFETRFETLQKSDLIILPEMFNTGFSMNAEKHAESMTGPTVQWLIDQAKKLKIHLAGTLIIKEGNAYFNRFVKSDPQGNIEHYDKRHAFSMAGEDKIYTKGTERVIWDVNGWKVCPMVCYDLRFPVWSRNDLDYDILVYSANWPTKRIKHWLSLVKARSIENQCYVAALSRIGIDGEGVEYNGNSLICDFDGEAITHNEGNDTILHAVLSHDELLQRRNKFGVLNDRDSFSVK